MAFRLAPRINAAGRMDVASEVIELFTTRDAARAAELAAKLERLNRERRDTEAAALTAIETRLATDAELAADRLLVIDGEGWHRGVIGILASRVVERTAKPAIVVSVEDGVAHGSGRSVDGFQLLNAIESCADLFTRFGGHAFAVGFALPADRLPELKRRLRLYAEEHLAAREPEHLLRIHAELPLDRITPVLAGWLRKLEPFGHGNPEPVFVARNVRLLAPPRIMKERHIRLELAQESERPDPAANPGPRPCRLQRRHSRRRLEPGRPRRRARPRAGQPHRPRLPHPRKRPPRVRRPGSRDRRNRAGWFQRIDSQTQRSPRLTVGF